MIERRDLIAIAAFGMVVLAAKYHAELSDDAKLAAFHRALKARELVEKADPSCCEWNVAEWTQYVRVQAPDWKTKELARWCHQRVQGIPRDQMAEIATQILESPVQGLFWDPDRFLPLFNAWAMGRSVR